MNEAAVSEALGKAPGICASGDADDRKSHAQRGGHPAGRRHQDVGKINA